MAPTVIAAMLLATCAAATTPGPQEDSSYVYQNGPWVANSQRWQCSDWYGKLEEAKSRCIDDGDCRALHDYDCDGQNWRFCSVTASAMEAAGGDARACTMVKKACPAADFSQSDLEGVQAYGVTGATVASGFIFSWLDRGYRKMVLTDSDGVTLRAGSTPDNSSDWMDPSAWAESPGGYSLSNVLLCQVSAPVRLVGGSSALDGRLEVYHDGQWGTVCDDYFGLADARVACRQLGFFHGVEVGVGSFGQGGGPIWLDNVACASSESNLSDCSHNGWGKHNCEHREDVGIQCEEVDVPEHPVRLVGGPSPLSGRLEVYHDGQWGTVCDDSFEAADAQVACRQLGFPSGVVASLGSFGRGYGQIWLDDVACAGSERNLSECSHNGWGESNCVHSEDVGIECDSPVRLVGGSSSLSGRLEVYYDGQWGTVCDDAFGVADAQVVCRQLGFFHGVEVRAGAFGQGSGPIWLDNVACAGSESDLLFCPHNGWGESNCRHSEDVGIQCEEVDVPENPVRLVGGPSPLSGRLEVYHDGRWGTVCDDSFEAADAQVACRQLGFSGGVVASSFGRGYGQIWLDDVACAGSERNLSECSHNGWGESNCGHIEDVGIECEANAPVRLVGGSSLSGRLEVYHDGQWGTVCDDDFGVADAQVVCRQLGFFHGVEVGVVSFGQGSDPIWLDNVACAGFESRLSACLHNGWGEHNCGHSEDVGIQCEEVDVPERPVRLVGGPSPLSGRLEVYHDGRWGTVCDDSFEAADAQVACRQLGFSGGVVDDSFGRGYGQIWLDDVACAGSERNLSECSHNGWGESNCDHSEDVGIECQGVCTTTDGSGFSSAYPCTCGDNTCAVANDICDAESGTCTQARSLVASLALGSHINDGQISAGAIVLAPPKTVISTDLVLVLKLEAKASFTTTYSAAPTSAHTAAPTMTASSSTVAHEDPDLATPASTTVESKASVVDPSATPAETLEADGAAGASLLGTVAALALTLAVAGALA